MRGASVVLLLVAGCSNSRPIGTNMPDLGMSDLPDGQVVDLSTSLDLASPDLSPAALPESCRHVRLADPNAADGNYTLYVGGAVGSPWTAYCKDMAGTPAEYLSLVMTGPSLNFSQYTAGGPSAGTNVRTQYNRLRLDPVTLKVTIGDQAFATSTGTLNHPEANPIAVTSVAYGVAMSCDGTASGLANVDLRGTPFAVAPNQFVPSGIGVGGATYSAADQVVDLTGGGSCGWTAAMGAYNPFNMAYSGAGGDLLQLVYR